MTGDEGGEQVVNLFLCSSPLQVVCAHAIALEHFRSPSDVNVLAVEGDADRRIVLGDLWAAELSLHDTRPEWGDWARKIRCNIDAIEGQLHGMQLARLRLFVSDLFWLMNNSLVAHFRQRARRERLSYEVFLVDEGTVMYTQHRLPIRARVRGLLKYVALRLSGLSALHITESTSGYRHPLCTGVYCFHPMLLDGLSQVPVFPVPVGQLGYARPLLTNFVALPARSCLYLSQPLYKLAGQKRQYAVVQRVREEMTRGGIEHFYYKSHHADLADWRGLLEDELGFTPLPGTGRIPIEVLIDGLQPAVLVSHNTSALVNIASSPFPGRVIACGLRELVEPYAGRMVLAEYRRVLRSVPKVEVLPE